MLNVPTKKIDIVYEPVKVKGGVKVSAVKIKNILSYTAGKRHMWVEAEDKDGNIIKIRKPTCKIESQN